MGDHVLGLTKVQVDNMPFFPPPYGFSNPLFILQAPGDG